MKKIYKNERNIKLSYITVLSKYKIIKQHVENRQYDDKQRGQS